VPRFIEENKLDGGHLISAQSGEAVLTAFYKVAATVAGVELSAAELEQTRRVLGVTVVAGDDDDDEEMSEEVRKIMEEDARHEAEKQRREANKGCCVVM